MRVNIGWAGRTQVDGRPSTPFPLGRIEKALRKADPAAAEAHLQAVGDANSPTAELAFGLAFAIVAQVPNRDLIPITHTILVDPALVPA
jgi:hypothetical protein